MRSCRDQIQSRLIWGLLLVCVVLTGCVSVAPPSQSLSELKTEEVKNYKLNEDYSVNVGDPIVVRRSYLYKLAQRDDRAKASKDFKLTAHIPLAHNITYHGRKDEDMLVVGTTLLNKHKYMILRIGENSGYGVGSLVDAESGQVSKTGVGQNAFGSWVTTAVSKIEVDPLDVTFTPTRSMEIDRSKPYENYEIIYTGRLGENVTFVYREYTPDNLAKPAFYQNLTYNLTEAKLVRFRKLQFESIPLRNEKGEIIYGQFSSEWISFLFSAIQQLLDRGELIKRDGELVVAKGLT